MLDPMPFDMTAVLQRLLDETYRIIAALPLLILALPIIWLSWLAGSWISQRAWLARASRSNPFLQDLARTTVRWIVFGLGILIALEILQATALVGAVLGTAGVLGVALGFAIKRIRCRNFQSQGLDHGACAPDLVRIAFR